MFQKDKNMIGGLYEYRDFFDEKTNEISTLLNFLGAGFLFQPGLIFMLVGETENKIMFLSEGKLKTIFRQYFERYFHRIDFKEMKV